MEEAQMMTGKQLEKNRIKCILNMKTFLKAAHA